MTEVQQAFVDAPVFADSTSRRSCWEGLQTYLELWSRLEKKIDSACEGRNLLKCLWLAGSFISDKINPSNVDLTLIVEADILARAAWMGLGVSKPLKSLSVREKALKDFRVSPIIIKYTYFRSPFPGGFEPEQAEYQQLRGGFDDWWCRLRQAGEDKQAPTVETGEWRRGYLEVVRGD
ncbi:hypothetical protein AB0H57_32475 [Micromonospora sp. NPDC050686]|uniref:DUF6932 family protein n=1 Tax=Micromonospora sp. NPDC050686 TaxID=3154631 RepID=UPI0033D7BFF4